MYLPNDLLANVGDDAITQVMYFYSTVINQVRLMKHKTVQRKLLAKLIHNLVHIDVCFTNVIRNAWINRTLPLNTVPHMIIQHNAVFAPANVFPKVDICKEYQGDSGTTINK